MKRFRFRLESLLRVRRITEEKCLRELKAREQDLATLERDLAALAEERASEVEAILNLYEGELDTERLLARRRYLNLLNNRTVEKAREKPPLMERVMAARRHLEIAMRNREAVTRLRERRYREHVAQAERVEQKEMDEMSRNAARYVERALEP